MRVFKRMKCALLVAVVGGLGAQATADERGLGPAVAADPVSVILNAFETHPLVALAEGQHWNEQGHAFRLSLIRDPRFAARVNDIVVEFGSARYQQLLQRFTDGADVRYDRLRQVWENTTQPNTVWDMPIYEEFFQAIHDLNRSLKPGRRIRVLLGDPPIDWANVSGKDDILRWMAMRDHFAADLVRKEVLAKNRRALLIFGDGHFFRSGPEATVVSLIEKEAPGTVFSIAAPTSLDLRAIQPDVANWRSPSVTLLRGTKLGEAPLGPYYELGGGEWESLPMESQFDAILYLGLPSTITLSVPSKSRCSDPTYLKMRLGRMALVPWGHDEVDRLNQFCRGIAKH
jgi:hypothetical protein